MKTNVFEAATATAVRAIDFDLDVVFVGDGAAIEQAVKEACANLCDELEQHWRDYKDTALLNGDIALSNAVSGELRAARAIASAIRALPPMFNNKDNK